MVVRVSNHGCLSSTSTSTDKEELNYFWTQTVSSIPGERIEIPQLHTSTWRCQKYRIKKYHAHVILDHGDQSLASGAKSHFHDPDNLEAEKAEFRAELKRKAADQN